MTSGMTSDITTYMTSDITTYITSNMIFMMTSEMSSDMTSVIYSHGMSWHPLLLVFVDNEYISVPNLLTRCRNAKNSRKQIANIC